MNDKYKLLQDNPQICKRLFGIKFELLETIPHRRSDCKSTKSKIFTRKPYFQSRNRWRV